MLFKSNVQKKNKASDSGLWLVSECEEFYIIFFWLQTTAFLSWGLEGCLTPITNFSTTIPKKEKSARSCARANDFFIEKGGALPDAGCSVLPTRVQVALHA